MAFPIPIPVPFLPSSQPLVNGTRVSWSSMTISVSGSIGEIYGFTSVSYKNTVERSKVRGSGRVAAGITAGDHDAEGELAMLFEDARAFLEALGAQQGNGRYMDAVFDMLVQYTRTEGGQVYSDEVVGCRLKEDATEAEQGPDGLVMTFPLDVMYVKRDGKLPVEGMEQ